jgi:hypothetical protein
MLAQVLVAATVKPVFLPAAEAPAVNIKPQLQAALAATVLQVWLPSGFRRPPR